VRKHIPAALLLLTLLSGFSWISIQNWILADTYSIRFSNPEVNGVFSKMDAAISFDESDLPASKFSVSADVGSVNTGNPGMDSQISGLDMLDKANFPYIKFESVAVVKTDTAFAAKGMLEMHGIKHEIIIPFTFRNKEFRGSFQVKCSDYGMNGMGKGEADIVRIELKVPVLSRK
jgi:polyisoprenoid-binding protein YceI